MDRISELTALSRQRELTEEEQAERKALREEYLADWRRGTLDVLENTYVVDEHANKRKLEKKQ